MLSASSHCQTAAPHPDDCPASIPAAAPHLAYLLVLLALLAADVATTVWFTALGLPEINPLLAPIAADVAAQVAYKAPFALALAAGTALLAAACDHLISGAGRYPWLAVAGIYAVPVAWNLVVIAGHTGFHVVPAVVYAPVAVVCAVGVWRAARPRPEALTMPANRPNPRPAAGGLLLALLLIGLFIPGVSAFSETYEEREVIGMAYTQSRGGLYGPATQTSIDVYDIAAYNDVKSIFLNANMDYARNEETVLRPNPYYDMHVTYQIGSTVIGDGHAYYNTLFNKNQEIIGVNLWLEIDNIDVSGYTGKKRITVVPDSGSLFNGVTVSGSYDAKSAPTEAKPILIGGTLSGSKSYMEGQYSILSEYYWKNFIDTEDGVFIQRVFGDKIYSSSISVYLDDMNIWVNDSSVKDFYLPGFLNGKWIIKSPTLVEYSGVFGEEDAGEEPLAAPVTIYVQNSQTGALLANALLSISAAAGDPIQLVEVVNATLPGGTGTYSLEKADYLKYHASATADGYTLLSPILFGVPENGTTIALWMAPDAPPDDPIEEGKSMLYGYVQTQGSQQPISGATVSLDGYGSTTTSSTGFYLFNNVTPDAYTISASAPLHDALSEPVTVETVATPYNLALKGHFLLTVSAKDADDLTTLHNTTISLSDGQESTQNPATFTADYGPYTITAAAGGYYPQTQSAYLDKPGTTTATVLLTARPEPVPPPEMPNYPPHNVRFHCIDDFGLPLANVTVSAAYLETTSPWSWFTDLLGIPETVAINETTLAGTTGSDGSITFSMVETVRYAIHAHDPASNLTVNFTLYPQETQYTIQFRTRPPSDAETHPIYNLEAVPLEGDTQVSLRLAYKDRDNATTSLLFWVKDGADEYVHTEALTPKYLNWTNASYTVENRPTSYTWGFDANHATRGEISAARSITLHGSGRLVDLGFEDEFWYLLLSAIWIVGIGAIFSGSRVRFGAIIIPLIGGGVPTLIGWLPLATTVPIGILTFIGVFVYMRKSEYKLYR